MMSNFFIDPESGNLSRIKYSYQDLLDYLSSSAVVEINYRNSDIYKYFCNLVLGLIHGLNLTILDLDFSDEECYKVLCIPYKPEYIQVKPPDTPYNFEYIRELIIKSESVLTIFTSGTTGLPKKVEHPVKNLIREVRVDNRYENDRWGYAYNPTHMAGLQLFFQCLLNQNLIVNLFSKSRDIALNSIKEFNLTNISATPSFYRLLMPIENTYQNVTKVTLGGEKSTNELLKQVGSMFPNARLYNIYASTEFGTILSSNAESFFIKPNYSKLVRIKDDILQVHVSLVGKSQNMEIDDNWYSTGDLVEYIDGSNVYFRFKGRKNELINVGGNKVNPTEVESELLKIVEIRECSVYGRQNSVLGTIVCADVVMFEGKVIDESYIREFLIKNLQNFKIPRKINFVKQISKNRAGKIEKNR
jgi:acyl-coenzyme A synthetase/AMP-(fatty) acid ligase